jgi:ribonuclease HI
MTRAKATKLGPDGFPVIIYTDGSCKGNPGPGGWAAILTKGPKRRTVTGSSEGDTTNNVMELMACIKALESLKTPSVVVLFTDSDYVRRGITEWLPQWKANAWKAAHGPVKNRALWERLEKEAARHDVTWKYVPGHSGHVLNEEADRLAKEAAEGASTGPGGVCWGAQHYGFTAEES